MRRPAVLSAVLATLLIPTPGSSAIWNVNPGGTGDAPTIQAAFDAASAGDTIVLAPGVYRDSHTVTFLDWNGATTTTTAIAFMKAGVSIVSQTGATFTTLDGEQDHHGLVGTDLGSVEVRGITFLDCRAPGIGGLGSIAGSGVMIQRSTATVGPRCLGSPHA